MASVGKLIVELEAKGVKLTKAQLKQLEGQGQKTGLSLKQMALRMGAATIATVAMQRAISGAIRVGMDFEQSMANVKAITGATGVEFQNLSRTAKELGSSTKFTASQVAGLQTEFGKLGFSTNEIMNAQSATLALAAATSAELPRAAEIAGATLRGFGLDAKETGRVTDVMALSFSKSALDMEKFAESMKFVAPVAKMAGFELEGTTALLGQLANAGLHGSMAGTALRSIFLKLADTNSSLSKRLGGSVKSVSQLIPALNKLKNEGVDLTEMLELTDKRAVTAFGVLLDGSEDVNVLEEALRNAGGSAQRMADIQLDTLQGKVTEMNSALEGLGITLFEMVDGPLESSVVGFTKFIQQLDAETIKSYGTAVTSVGTAYLFYAHGAKLARIGTVALNSALAKTPWGLFAIGATAVIAKTLEAHGVFKETTTETINLSNSLRGVNKELEAKTNQDIIQMNMLEDLNEMERKKIENLDATHILDQISIRMLNKSIEKRQVDIDKLKEKIEIEKELAKVQDGKNGDGSSEQMSSKLTELDQFFIAQHTLTMDKQQLEIAQQEEHYLELAKSDEERLAVEQIFEDKRNKLKKKSADVRVKLEQDAQMQLAQATAMGLKQFAGGAKAAARIQQIAATVEAYRTINKIMADPKLVFPTNVIQATTVGATAFANVMAISKSIGEFKTAATGADYVTNGPEMLMVGENPGGRERVQVTPLSSPNIDGPQGGNVVVNVSGNVMSQDYVEGELADQIRDAIRKGSDFGVS